MNSRKRTGGKTLSHRWRIYLTNCIDSVSRASMQDTGIAIRWIRAGTLILCRTSMSGMRPSGRRFVCLAQGIATAAALRQRYVSFVRTHHNTSIDHPLCRDGVYTVTWSAVTVPTWVCSLEWHGGTSLLIAMSIMVWFLRRPSRTSLRLPDGWLCGRQTVWTMGSSIRL